MGVLYLSVNKNITGRDSHSMEVTRLLKRHIGNACKVKNSNYVIISCKLYSAAARLSAAINRYAFETDEPNRRITQIKNNTYVLITFADYQMIISKYAPDILNLLSNINESSDPLLESMLTQSVSSHNEKKSAEDKKKYHNDHKDRYRHDVAVLKDLFKQKMNYNTSLDADVITISIDKLTERHDIVRAFNNFSYLVEPENEKLATSRNSVIFIPRQYYEKLKKDIESLVCIPTRNLRNSLGAKEQYHILNPERKTPDITVTKNFLNNLNLRGQLFLEYETNSKAHNIATIVSRCSYLVREISVVKKKDKTVTILNQPIFDKMLKYFLPNEKNRIATIATTKPILHTPIYAHAEKNELNKNSIGSIVAHNQTECIDQNLDNDDGNFNYFNC